MNPVRQHPIVTLGVIIFFAITALVVFRLSSGAKVDQKKSRVITVGTVTPLKQDLEIRRLREGEPAARGDRPSGLSPCG